MEGDVFLIIKGSVVDSEDDHESVELETKGYTYEEDGYTCFSYQESPMTGMEGTSTVIKVKEDQVSVIRIGTVNSIMEFETGNKSVTLYSTPYGEISMEISTQEIDIKREDDRITHVLIRYSISVSGITNTHNIMDIKVKY